MGLLPTLAENVTGLPVHKILIYSYVVFVFLVFWQSNLCAFFWYLERGFAKCTGLCGDESEGGEQLACKEDSRKEDVEISAVLKERARVLQQ